MSGRAVEDDAARSPARLAPALVRVRPRPPRPQLAQQPAALGRLPPIQTQRAVRRHRRRVPRPPALGAQSRTAPHVLRQDPPVGLHLSGRTEPRGAQDLGRRRRHRRRGLSTVLIELLIAVLLLCGGQKCPPPKLGVIVRLEGFTSISTQRSYRPRGGETICPSLMAVRLAGGSTSVRGRVCSPHTSDGRRR